MLICLHKVKRDCSEIDILPLSGRKKIFIEVRSENTEHYWIIFKKTYDRDKPIVLYHKHTANDKWYHKHWKCYSVRSAVAGIKSHDKYVLKGKEK